MVKISEIIKTLEPRWFMPSMATGAVGVALSFFNIPKIIPAIFVYLAIFFFILTFIIYFVRIFAFTEEVIKDLTHPVANNFFAAIYISVGVLITGVLNVLLKYNYLNKSFALFLAKLFYLIGLIFLLILVIAIPLINYLSEKVDTKHSLGIWFLPPVGIFVFIFAGNFLAMHNVFREFILLINPLLMGLAFVWWFIRMNFIFYRIKFHPLPPPEMAPSFVIGLAPIGVSVIATLTFGLLTKNELILSLAKGFGVLIYGFGLWWASIVLGILTYYLIKHKIKYSLGFWAFVFPPAAFAIGAKLLANSLEEYNTFFNFVFYVFAIIATIAWIYVFYKTLIGIITGKAFERPKTLKN
ncbi:MAG: hypothetical protein ABGW69_01020 [Nanoarchaeota archaeon]